MDNVELTKIFQNVGRSFGYTNVTAFFSTSDMTVVPFLTLEGGLEWYVPDCFKTMSEYIMRDMAFSYYDAFVGRPLRFMPDVIDYILSNDFVRANRPIYLKRNHAEDGPRDYVDGIPIYYGPRNTYSRMFRAIIVNRHNPVSKTSMINMACSVHKYADELRSMVFCDKLHADCRHCISPHNETCQYAKDINNPPFKENCHRHTVAVGVPQ